MSDEKEKKHHHHGHDKPKGPTAGPDFDDRGPDPQRDEEAALLARHIDLAHDFHARIIGYTIEGGMTQLLLGGGFKHGLTDGMKGYIPAGQGGMLAEFEIHGCNETACRASVDVHMDQIRAHGDRVVINPSSMPAKAAHHNQKARIIKVSIEGGKTRIGIGNGNVHGTTFGEKGFVTRGGSRVAGGSFTVDEVHSTFSLATVELTIDELKDCEVLLSPG